MARHSTVPSQVLLCCWAEQTLQPEPSPHSLWPWCQARWETSLSLPE